jgi:hypothetical protein
MQKDFLCFDYSWVPNSRFMFNKLSETGYSVDIVDEKNYESFDYAEDYRFIILYLHEYYTISLTNQIIERYPNAKLIQHDDTDLVDIQDWSEKTPDLVMQRELVPWSKNPRGCTTIPHHFPISSLYNENTEKENDIFFYGTMTNNRRFPVVKKLWELKEGALSHLKWDMVVTAADQRTPEEYKKAINNCKVGIHCFGNSYDSWRIWELASCGVCTIMPESPLLSISPEHNHYDEYIRCQDSFDDIEEVIEEALSDNNWRKMGEKALAAYDESHSPQKCFELYLENLKSVFPELNYIRHTL